MQVWGASDKGCQHIEENVICKHTERAAWIRGRETDDKLCHNWISSFSKPDASDLKIICLLTSDLKGLFTRFVSRRVHHTLCVFQSNCAPAQQEACLHGHYFKRTAGRNHYINCLLFFLFIRRGGGGFMRNYWCLSRIRNRVASLKNSYWVQTQADPSRIWENAISDLMKFELKLSHCA